MRKPIEVSGDRFKEAEQSVKYKDWEKKHIGSIQEHQCLTTEFIERRGRQDGY